MSEVTPLGLQVELVAYARSERLATLATTDGPPYDLAAVVGLLNSLLRERGSDLRFLGDRGPVRHGARRGRLDGRAHVGDRGGSFIPVDLRADLR